MPQFFGLEVIKEFEIATATTLTWLEGSIIRVGGQGYNVVGDRTLDLATDIDTGSVAANTVYYIYAIPQINNLSLVYSLSGTAPTGFTTFRKIAGFLTDGASEVVGVSIKDEGKVGDTKQSMLSEAQFIQENGAGWVLCDGRGVTGSKYETITAQASIPDARGRFLRAKDNGASVNPDGDLALGTTQGHAFGSHNHGSGVHNHSLTNVATADNGSGGRNHGGDVTTHGLVPNTNDSGTIINTEGGNETRPANVTMNVFIKINDIEL